MTMASTAFPWVEHLPESEQISFWNGLRIALHNTHACLLNPTAHNYEMESAPVIAMWRDRAQQYASMSVEERQREAARATAREAFYGPWMGEVTVDLAEEVADKILAAIRKVD
jgi:hypothetical protein